MVETIIFVNKSNEKFIIESSDKNYYDFDEFEFNVDSNCEIDKELLEFDGWGIPQGINIYKAFKPLKFYKITWWEEDSNTPDGHDYADIITNLEEIDYLNQGDNLVKENSDMKKMFISFGHSKGFGNCIQEISGGIKDAADIRDLEMRLKSENSLTGVAVLNIMALPII